MARWHGGRNSDNPEKKRIDSIGNNGLNKGETGAQQKVRTKSGKWKVASNVATISCHCGGICRTKLNQKVVGEDRDLKPNNLTILPR